MSSTSTASSTTNEGDGNNSSGLINALRAEINVLMHRLQSLEVMLQSLLNNESSGGDNGNNSGSATSTPPVSDNGEPSIDQMNAVLRAGSSIDWSGRNFASEEDVRVTLNGESVAEAHADGGGNFSTGSVSVPLTAGTYTYNFIGSKGSSASATIMVTR